MIVSLWWAYFPFVQSTCSIKCSAAMCSLQQDHWQFAHHQLYPQQQSTDPDQVLFLPTCPSTVLLQFKVHCSHALLAAKPLAICAPPALPQQQSTDPDQVLYLPTCPSTVLLQFNVQCSHELLAARPLAVCAPPALPPVTIKRPGSGAFLANLSLYG